MAQKMLGMIHLRRNLLGCDALEDVRLHPVDHADELAWINVGRVDAFRHLISFQKHISLNGSFLLLSMIRSKAYQGKVNCKGHFHCIVNVIFIFLCLPQPYRSWRRPWRRRWRRPGCGTCAPCPVPAWCPWCWSRRPCAAPRWTWAWPPSGRWWTRCPSAVAGRTATGPGRPMWCRPTRPVVSSAKAAPGASARRKPITSATFPGSLLLCRDLISMMSTWRSTLNLFFFRSA